MIKNLPAMQKTQVNPWVRKISWTREWKTNPILLSGKSHGQRRWRAPVDRVAKSDMTE